MSQVNALIDHIKKKLKASGMTYRDLATRIDVSESTLKRWFSQNSFNIERLDQICAVLAVDLGDLIPHRTRKIAVQSLAEHQELELAADETLLAIFYLLLAGRTVTEIATRYELSPARLRTYLLRLDRCELIELHPGDRAIPLVTQSIRWLPEGPLHKKYGKQIRSDFMESSFTGKHEKIWLLSGKVSVASLQVFDRKLAAVLEEFRELMDLDHDAAPEETINVTFFAAHRPWALPMIKGKRQL